MDAAVLERYQQRSPETPAASCVYFQAELEELYRFCFVEDQLVDKTVVLPDGSAPAR